MGSYLQSRIAFDQVSFDSRVFYKHTTLAIMPILAIDALLRQNKIIQWQNVTHGEDWTQASD